MNAEFTCPKCGTGMVVVPPEIGHFRRPQDQPVVVERRPLAVRWTRVETDETGGFVCPNPECDFEGDYESIGSA